MNQALSQVYSWAHRFSRRAAILATLIFAILNIFNISTALSAQLVVALIALAAGIPHGAIDHLITLPKEPRAKFIAFIVIYVLVAIAAGLAIANWNRIGFQIVVLMSSLHFGFGDAAYFNEWRDAEKKKRNKFLIGLIYALPAGFLPVVLPLTDHRALRALERINPSIADWAGTLTSTFRTTTLVFAAIAFLALLIARRLQKALDLVLLACLSLIAPPLITFAIYFGCWHAVRHTARLVPKLPKAMLQVSKSAPSAAIREAIVPGLYAVVGTLALATGLLLFARSHFCYGLLWSTLVIVWSLTVPHMATTARFDLSSFKVS
ncbi:MAG: Brp/Blh family beta-carotene 15,15'-dioxygenase [Actinomycetes bacterium]